MQKDAYLSEDRKEFPVKRFIGLLSIPVILFILPLEWLKDQHTICLYKNITGNECYGCGMTRAILSAIHLKFADAFNYNKLVLFVLPVLIYIWGKKLLNLWSGKLKSVNSNQ
jgi:hypothetical protein